MEQHIIFNRDQDSTGTKGYYSTISSSSKLLIDENYTYYLGNVVYGSSGDTTITAYNNERDENNIWSTNQPDWEGAISLLYPSDVGYAAHNSYWSGTKLSDYDGSAVVATSWMMQNANHSFEFLLSPSSRYSYLALLWSSSGHLYGNTVNGISGARPVLNLKSETTSLDGRDGSINLPYVFIGG